jgi:two-component system, NarL family, response regulator NreC
MTMARVDDRISVLLVDELNVVTAGLRALLERQPSLDVLAYAASADRAAELGAEPDVVVSELELGDTTGRELVARLHEMFAGSAILVLTLADDPCAVRQALDAGAAGYLLKSASPHDLFLAIRSLARGESYLQPSLGARVARQTTQRTEIETPLHAKLNETEREVFRLLVLGYTNAEIAEMRGVSLRTVETQRAQVFNRLGCRTRAELVQYALELGIADFGA